MRAITVGSAIAHAGEKVSGFIQVPKTSDPGCEIPVTIVCGAKEGPVLALVAGTHGSEPSPIIALQRIRKELDPAEVSGSVIMVQIANVPSFQRRTIYRGPYDEKNLNRVFPGKANGTASERIAHAITTHVIDQCDYLVDMHSGDGNEALRPYSYWNQLGLDERVDARARDIALAFGIDHIVIDTTRPRDPSASSFCSNTAHTRGKPAVTTEAGGIGVPAEDMVRLNARGAIKVMQHLGMLRGKRPTMKHPKWMAKWEVLTSPDTGTWHPAVKPDQHVKQGHILGRLTNYFGEPIAEVTSPIDGVVLYIVVSPAMGRGEPIGMVGQISR